MKTLGILPPFNRIGRKEWQNIQDALRSPLSGYLGGRRGAGYWVTRLEQEWGAEFGGRAIACNSATSGLWAACRAVGIGPGDEVWTTPYSMSATAACAALCGAKLRFIDIEPVFFSLNMNMFTGKPKAIIVANLFGHPAYLLAMRSWCNANGVYLIEDNAQSPFAKEQGRYAGTIGHIGVFSLNIHKHIQSGEGGVVVTNDERLAERVFESINHGEVGGGLVGLNLRMTELTAAVACAQLDKAHEIIEGRREFAHALSQMFLDAPFVHLPVERQECRHVYYLWAGLVTGGLRGTLINHLNMRGVPFRAGYSPLLTGMFDPVQKCPVAQRVEDTIIVFEVCAYDPSAKQLQRMRELVKEAVGVT